MAEIAASPPDWSHVHFDVHCARCGEDLFGRAEAVCPTCDLAFDWDEAVPLEALRCGTCDYPLYRLTQERCPECGEAFAWDDVVTNYRQRDKRVFEYRWREQPVRSWWASWRAAVRPETFWTRAKLYDPTPVGALVGLVISTTVLSIALTSCFMLLCYCVFAAVSDAWSFYLRFSVATVSRIVFESTWRLGALETVALASMMLYRQSMQRGRLRNGHIVRIWAYSVGLLVPVYVFVGQMVLFAAGFVGRQFALPNLWSSTLAQAVPVALFGVCAVHVAWSVRCGFGDYLKMPHAWGVAIATVVMTCLATVMVFVLHVWF